MSLYPYKTLNLPFETRVLVIEPGSFDGVLRCSIRNVSLSSPSSDSFEALSYCWAGSQIDEVTGATIVTPTQSTIICDGIHVTVGYELHVALKYLRSEKEPLSIWVDALCINQNDVAERNEHVKLMSRIYKGASIVRIWLGEDRGTAAQAVASLDLLARVAMELYEGELPDSTARIHAEELLQMAHCHSLGYALIEDSRTRDVDLAPVLDLLNRAWFRRIWIVQEVSISVKATVHIGPITVSWDWFQGNTLIWGTLFLLKDSPAVGLSSLTRVLSSYGVANLEDVSLFWLLAMTRHLGSTDPADKIYGLLALVSTRTRNVIEPDYSLSTSAFFVWFALDTISKDQSLSILSHCTLRKRHTIPNLPSWVPDWSVPLHYYPSCELNPHFKASGERPIRYRVCEETKTLHVAGILIADVEAIDTVRTVPRPQFGTSTSSDIEALKHVHPRFSKEYYYGNWNASIAESDAVYKSIGKIAFQDERTAEKEEALWRTFVCNRSVLDNTKPIDANDDMAVYFEHSMRIERENGSDFHPLRVGELAHAKDGGIALKNQIPSEQIEIMKNGSKQVLLANAAWTDNRRFFRTRDGHLGWGPGEVRPGDQIAILFGSNYPFVLRGSSHGTHEIVGDCYCHGIMEGEVFEGEFVEREFRLV